ncbi:type IV toxin-antitoxin system AbiEi family antitoxin domain-containing protein [Microlunatus sp. GCM10028923]|uniref:type IV toxin-antitoxin system AbiEi family antitoxin domain-containing protein n=1 Tax=Microlunatus sp. GCM10028923 TaxID=3273400 RepID=UPI00360ADA3B
MVSAAYPAVAELAELRWGMVTTAQAEQVGVSRAQLSRMADKGLLTRLVQGVYRVAGAPELEHEAIYATWLALGGATRPATPDGVPAVVAGGVTAAVLHGIGDFWPEHDFLVPARRTTRLPAVRLRIRHLATAEVSTAEGVPVLTVERTIADLVNLWIDTSLITDTLRDGIQQGKLVNPRALIDYLSPYASRHDHPAGDGQALAAELIERAGIEPLGWPSRA